MHQRRLVTASSCTEPLVNLVCLPHAGGSTAAFGNWHEFLPDMAVAAVEFPGRGGLFRLPAIRSLGELAEWGLAAIEPLPRRRSILFGHSMGAVVALEMARRLAARGLGPSALVVSASPAPHLKSRRSRHLHSLPEAELISELGAMGGLPAALLNNASVLKAFLPTIRADLEARERWVGTPFDLGIPIVALGGIEDVLVRPEELQAWREFTSRPFKALRLPGAHFPQMTHPEIFFRTLRDALGDYIGPIEAAPSTQFRRGMTR